MFWRYSHISAGPARAQVEAPGGGLAASYSANADKPMDIESDSLEVDDKKKIATFKGNVSATQGDFNLRAKEIQVTYTDSKKSGTKKETASNAPTSPIPGGGAGDIQQIDAKGKVLMNAKDGQTATSDWAVFEVKKQARDDRRRRGTHPGHQHHQGQQDGDRPHDRTDPAGNGRR